MSIIMGPPMSIIGGLRSMNPFLSKGWEGPRWTPGSKAACNRQSTNTDRTPMHSDDMSFPLDSPSLLSLSNG